VKQLAEYWQRRGWQKQKKKSKTFYLYNNYSSPAHSNLDNVETPKNLGKPVDKQAAEEEFC
jgi:hypothetical protein